MDLVVRLPDPPLTPQQLTDMMIAAHGRTFAVESVTWDRGNNYPIEINFKERGA